MLEIDRGPGDERAAPTAGEAGAARDAARAAPEQLARERERLPGMHAEAVSRGDFETSRQLKDKMALLADHVVFAEGQLLRAELALLTSELGDAERDATCAADQLMAAFAEEERARSAYQAATSARAGAQAQVQAYTARVEQLRREHAQARRRLDGADKEP